MPVECSVGRVARCQWPAPTFVWHDVVYRCEGQRHREGGRAHSATTPDGLIIWWEYGNGRTAKVLRAS